MFWNKLLAAPCRSAGVMCSALWSWRIRFFRKKFRISKKNCTYPNPTINQNQFELTSKKPVKTLFDLDQARNLKFLTERVRKNLEFALLFSRKLENLMKNDRLKLDFVFRVWRWNEKTSVYSPSSPHNSIENNMLVRIRMMMKRSE